MAYDSRALVNSKIMFFEHASCYVLLKRINTHEHDALHGTDEISEHQVKKVQDL